jgi:hypothetical protein
MHEVAACWVGWEREAVDAEEAGRELESVIQSKCANLLLTSSSTSFCIMANRLESQTARRQPATPAGAPSPRKAPAERGTEPPSRAPPGGRVAEQERRPGTGSEQEFTSGGAA